MSITEFPLNIPQEKQEEIASWYSQEVYAKLAEKEPTNRWLKIEETIDFEPVEAACQEYHQRKSKKNVPHQVQKMVKVLFVKYMLGTSLRGTAERVRYDLQIKRFVGYEIQELGCHYSTIDRFEMWVSENEPRIYFDTVLKEVDKRYGEVERAKIQYADTFAMEANAAKMSLIGLLRQMSDKVMGASAVANQCAEGKLWLAVDSNQLFGEEGEKHWSKLTQPERDKRLFNTVCGAMACQEVVKSQLVKDKATRIRWAQLEKILSDEVTIERNETGEVVQVKRLGKGKRGQYRIGSGVDPEATYREHGQGKATFGYNISVATTAEFVREIRADTGATPDSQPLPALLEAQQAHHEHLPAKIVYDKAAGDGKTVGRVAQVTQGKTQLVVQMRDYDKRTKLFVPRDFHYDAAAFTLTCPNGVTSTRFYRHGSKSGWTVRFRRQADGCATCPLLQRCYKNPETQLQRDVFISDYFVYYVCAILYMTSETFRDEVRQRAHVERIIAALVRHNDARHARRRGTAAADFQAKMAAAAYNTKKLLRKLQIDPLLG